MSYKTEFQSNNIDLQAILDAVNALEGGTTVIESTFTPANSGGVGYKSKFDDNNIDLQKILDMALSLPVKPSVSVVDFEYTNNGDGTVTLTAWKETYNGESSTECIIPDDSNIIL